MNDQTNSTIAVIVSIISIIFTILSNIKVFIIDNLKNQYLDSQIKILNKCEEEIIKRINELQSIFDKEFEKNDQDKDLNMKKEKEDYQNFEHRLERVLELNNLNEKNDSQKEDIDNLKDFLKREDNDKMFIDLKIRSERENAIKTFTNKYDPNLLKDRKNRETELNTLNRDDLNKMQKAMNNIVDNLKRNGVSTRIGKTIEIVNINNFESQSGIKLTKGIFRKEEITYKQREIRDLVKDLENNKYEMVNKKFLKDKLYDTNFSTQLIFRSKNKPNNKGDEF